jgi:hypothetical protein
VPKTPCILRLILVFVLSVLGHAFAESQIRYDPNLTKHTAECYFTSFGTSIRVKPNLELIGPDIIHLLIRNPSTRARIEEIQGTITIRDGMFSCYHSLQCKVPKPWCKKCTTVKRQELILDKKTYIKGDVVTGRIDFECLFECPECSNKPTPVMVKGVFKTILK